MNAVEFYLEDLASKFTKINPNDYYLAYSGGRDSHFLLWFIREYLHETRIPAVFCNTGMEIPEIRDRALANADVVLKPAMKHAEIKEKYGIPLNTKSSDYWVWQYQKRKEQGIADEEMPGPVKCYAMREIGAIPWSAKTGRLPKVAATKNTSEAMKNGTLHKVSPKCCQFLKKEPSHKYEKESGKKPILGVMGEESIRRKLQYKSCFSGNGRFHPLWDLTAKLQQDIEREREIPIPNIYQYTNQTGCAGCPYGQHGANRFFGTNIELSFCKEGQRKFIMEYFRESYEFKGYEFRPTLFSL